MSRDAGHAFVTERVFVPDSPPHSRFECARCEGTGREPFIQRACLRCRGTKIERADGVELFGIHEPGYEC